MVSKKWLLFLKNINLVGGQTYHIEYIYSNAGGPWYVGGVGINGQNILDYMISTSCNDTDNDSITNDFDLDSDNDGCPEAIEGGANFIASNIDANEMLTGGVDSNGVPTVAGANGQTTGSSQDTNVQDPDCPPPCTSVAPTLSGN